MELYDTRKSLEETRRELSSALYQNDAAVRVVARLVRERDEARGALEEFLARGGVNNSAAAPAVAAGGGAVAADQSGKKSEKRAAAAAAAPVEEEEEDGPPSSKKARADNTEVEEDLSKIPQETLTIMTSTWEILSKNRRTIAKKSKRSKEQIEAQDKLLADALSKNGEEEGKKVNLGKSTAKAGVLCVSKVSTSCHLNNTTTTGGRNDGEYIVRGGHDKQAIVYDVTTGQIVATLTGAGGDVINVSGMVVSENVMLVGTGSKDGVVRLYSVPTSGSGSGGDTTEEVQLLGSGEMGGEGVLPVSVVVHFSSTVEGATIIVGGSDGSVNVFKSSSESGLKLITHLKAEDGIEFSSGCIHPDGLIYAAGTTTGKLLIYDLKTQAVAGTLQGHDGNPINCISVSENGYHVATSSSSSGESPIHIWDLRKLKLSATITPPSDVGTVTSLAFDPMGLYLAYSGVESTKICVVKDWDRVVRTLSKTKTGRKGKKKTQAPTCGGVVWGGKGLDDDEGKVWIAAGCDGEKPIRFWGVE